jgi:hypothetical protein
MARKKQLSLIHLIQPALVLALAAVAGVAIWQHSASATTESSGATTEKQQLAQVQTRASSEIDRRIKSLTALTPLVGKLTNPQPAEQKSYHDAVTQEITTLQRYSAAINGDATLAAATTDAQKLTPEYTAFMVLVPKTWLIITADWQQVLESKLATYANKIQDRLSTASNAGKDTSAAQITLNDLQSHINLAQGASDDVAKAVPETRLGQYNANHAVLVTHYDKLNTAHSNLKVAFDDAQKLLTDLQRL